MKDAFAEVESIWTRCIETAQKKFDTDILALLKDQGIRIRQDDGDLKQLTLSKPTSVNSGFVIGLRYIKKDGSHTEDLFSVEQGQQVKSFYKILSRSSGRSIAGRIIGFYPSCWRMTDKILFVGRQN